MVAVDPEFQSRGIDLTYGEDDKASLVLHQLDEQIHHGAELGVLRDLYARK